MEHVRNFSAETSLKNPWAISFQTLLDWAANSFAFVAKKIYFYFYLFMFLHTRKVKWILQWLFPTSTFFFLIP